MTGPMPDAAQRIDQPFAARGQWTTIDPVAIPLDTTEFSVLVDSVLEEGVLVDVVIDFSLDGKTWASGYPDGKVPRELNPFPIPVQFAGGATMKDGKGGSIALPQYSRSLKLRPRHFSGGDPIMRVMLRSSGGKDVPVPASLLYTNAGEKAIDENDEPTPPPQTKWELG